MNNTLSKYSLVMIATILGFMAIYWLKPVLLPSVVALFIIAIVWPVKIWFDHILPKKIGYILCYLVIGLILLGLAAIIYAAISELTNQLPQYEDRAIALINTIRTWLARHGLPAPRKIELEQVQGLIGPFVSTFYTTLGHVGLITALVILGLPELVFWQEKLKKCFDEKDIQKWNELITQSVISFQKYMTVTTLTGILAALLTSVFCWLVGLDLALLWGVMAFILNFVPVVGSMLMLLPPTLMAMMQFTDSFSVMVVFWGMGAIQFLMGNIIDPQFQGKCLSMSPVMILISIAFWGIIWGVPGAFLAIPLTHIFITALQFQHKTQSIACMLTQNSVDEVKTSAISS